MRYGVLLIIALLIVGNKWKTDNVDIDELVKLYICTEKAPELCAFYDYTLDEARSAVEEACGDEKANLSAVLDREDLVDIECVVDPAKIIGTPIPLPTSTPKPNSTSTPGPTPTSTPGPVPTSTPGPAPTSTPGPVPTPQ